MGQEERVVNHKTKISLSNYIDNHFTCGNTVCLTADVDWASEYVLDCFFSFFHESGIPLTVFTTHHSDVLNNSLVTGLVKSGIHPNFLPNSSQGSTYEEVIAFCTKLIPDAIGFRSHRYYSSNDICELLYRNGMKYSSNVCTLLTEVYPFVNRNRILEFPIFLEDGAYLLNKNDICLADMMKSIFECRICVINIHPMHFVANSSNFTDMAQIKKTFTRKEWAIFSENEINKIKSTSFGIKNLIEEIMETTAKLNANMCFLEDIYHRVKKHC